jgi:RNA-directed DNA polymerase
MERICERENLKAALRRVKANKGSAGIDGMTVAQIGDYLKQHWPIIREQLLSGTYEPKPVRRVEIAKPDGNGMRKLGIPTVLDRFIQQAVMQILQQQWDPTFSDHSYGFRPGRSAHQAVARAQSYIAQGYNWVIDLDLEQFFDRVNHDKLMGQIAKRVEDTRLLKLIRAFLNAGVMERIGQPKRGRDSARRATFALVKQHRTRRARPGAGASRTPFRALCGRWKYLRSQPTSGSAGDGTR